MHSFHLNHFRWLFAAACWLISSSLCLGFTLQWDANSDPETVGYRVYYGTSSGNYTTVLDAAAATSATISDPPAGVTYFAVVTAYDSASLESLPSNEVATSLVQTTITTVASPVSGGSTSGGGTVVYGTGVSVVATPNAGYNFVNWTEGGSSVSTSASYTFTVNADRTLQANFSLGNNANLASMVPNTGILSPAFNSAATSYTTRVSFATTTFALTPVVAQTGATVTINGNAVASGNASGLIPLSIGANRITVSVTAPDGVTKMVYTLAVTRTGKALGIDANSDGNADILFQNTAGQIAVWCMNGRGAASSSAVLSSSALGDWKIAGIADMNNDGNADILFQNTAGQIAVWYMNGRGAASSSAWLYSGALGDWKIAGIADMNNDGNADILFQNTTGQIVVWYMNGKGQSTGSGYLSTVNLGDWKIAGIADMNNDGNPDILFQNTTGQIVVWYMNGKGQSTGSGYLSTVNLGDWKIAGIADMNNDGNPDILFQNTTGQIAVWYMNGKGQSTGSALLYSGSLGDWRVR